MTKHNRTTVLIVFAILAFAVFCRWWQGNDMDVYIEKLKSPSGDITYACIYDNKADYIAVKIDRPYPTQDHF